ncbi:PKD domain-containing protein [Arthrobacter sp. CAN_C5]|uniref:PKD domain-containing protein n=1 Tax=Arthrobacter sp. CAN_C5 TaxID=2760706 RepID=UPI001AE904B4|nr:PKD domain-containing protein [Arthrobacter sp. CAN_C5]MBP2218283.1 PKD repeat protein [Arthrobacter sp. CAN_C5]
MRKLISILLGLLMVAGFGVAIPGAATASEQTLSSVVRSTPVNYTPHVLDGIVFSVAEVGDTIVLGGSFTQVQASAGGPVLTRNGVVAFNKNNGQISAGFAPQFNSTVRSVVAAADGQSVYVGGQFGTLNGASTPKVVRLALSNGARITAFNAGNINAVVHDMKLSGNRLFIGGEFTAVRGQARTALAELDPVSGALRTNTNIVFAGTHRGGNTFVHKFDVTPDGRTMVVTGNFTTMNGLDRVQVGMVDLSSATSTVANWQTNRWKPNCYSVFAYYLNDLDISPDGSYFVLGSMGGYGSGPPTLCDTVSRWETNARGAALNPVWVDYTGGDSVYALEATGHTVYFGGHNRWMNNPFRADAAGQGAVGREGIGALSALSGLPMKWNPGRDRGRGVFDLLATSQGLWVGSDTDRIARYLYHAKIALFPVAGGTAIPAASAPSLPVDVLQSGKPSGQTNQLSQVYFTGSQGSSGSPNVTGTVPWDNVRGGFVAAGSMYLAMANGELHQRSFNGSQIGGPTILNLYGLTNFANEMQTMTGLFYSNGRIYFTLAGQTSLFMRHFEIDSGIVGAQRFTIAGATGGMTWSNVRGMFLASNRLYWASADGNLNALDWTESVGDGTVSGTSTTVSGPVRDGTNWTAKALITKPGTAPPPANGLPSARFNQTCDGLECTFNGAGSTDPDGTVDSYAWTSSDGESGTAAVFTREFATAGTYDVTVTVTDNDGTTSSTTQKVTVSNAPPMNEPPSASFSQTCDGLECTFNGAGSTDSDGTINTFAWTSSDGGSGTAAVFTREFASAGTYDVAVTVTVTDGTTSSIIQTVTVSNAPPLNESPLIRFPDVAGNLHEDAINWLADQGLTNGYSDGTYRPPASINRDAMAAFLYRLAGEPAYAEPTTSPFADITPETQFYKEMAWMAETGLSTGYSDGTFRPLAPVNRDAMAAFMNRFAGEYCSIADAEDYEAPQVAPFPDVPVNDQFHREISWMAENEITTGFPDGEYKRLQPVARDAMAAFIQRLDGYTENNGGCNP